MKKLLLVLLFESFFGFAQENFNKLDENNLKQGIWKGFYPESKRLRYQGTFEHGKETGTFNFYDDTKAGDIIGVRVFNLIENSVYTTFYDQKKNIVSEGKSINKLKEGIWKYYHFESKALMTMENYFEGKLDGLRLVYFVNGNIAEKCNYKSGVKDGQYYNYSENGIVLESSIYKNGEYDGLAIYKNTEGIITGQGVYKSGKKTGKWQFLNGKKTILQNMNLQGKKFAKKIRTN